MQREQIKTRTKKTEATKAPTSNKTREGSGYLKQLYSTAKATTSTTQSSFRSMTTLLVNFVPVDKIDPSEHQVRTHFDPSEIEGLAISIKKHGVLQPILVVQNGERYKVIAGERRLRATKEAGLERIPARVITSDDDSVHEIALRENLDRVDLHPVEEGEGYVTLLEAQVYTSHDAIAKAFGKPKSRITECIGFTRLPNETKITLIEKAVKNRRLLRDLMTAPAEQHLSMIEDRKEEEAEITSDRRAKATPATANKTEAKTAPAIRWDDTGIKVPSFRWKAGSNKAPLRIYIKSMRKLLNDMEKKLLQQEVKTKKAT